MSEQSIIIQKVSEGTITVSINGQIKEIQNQLEELKSLLQNQKTQTIQYADKIYNIEHINEANFGLMTGKKAFNEWFIKQMIEAIAVYSPDAQKVLQYVKGNNIADWEKQERFSNRAKGILAYSFVGTIGIQINKLMAIGNDKASNFEDKQRNYIEKSIYIAKRTLDLINFTFLSKFWDTYKKQSIVLNENQKKVLQAFLNTIFEFDFFQQHQLLSVFFEIFEEHKIALPFTEMQNFKAILDKKHSFYQTCEKLQELNGILDKEEYNLLHCSEVERALVDLLSLFGFLVNYKMVSIKQIGYKHIRNTQPNYVHKYLALGIDNKANQDAEKFNYTEQGVPTEAVLIYKGEHYEESINLFPFVIDYNALTFEHGAKICFFKCIDIADNHVLEYHFLENNSTQNIEFKGVLTSPPNYNELVSDKEKYKKFNIDNVILAFKEAQGMFSKSLKTEEDDFDMMFN